MKGYIEERAVEIANYIIDNNATVRQTAKQFGISKSTVHTDATKRNDLIYIKIAGDLTFYKIKWVLYLAKSPAIIFL